MECPFQVGDEVVCVVPESIAPAITEVGSIYEISEIGVDRYVRLYFKGLPREGIDVAGNYWRGFQPSGFRKVQKPKTDIHAWLARKPGDTRKLDRSRKAVPA